MYQVSEEEDLPPLKRPPNTVKIQWFAPGLFSSVQGCVDEGSAHYLVLSLVMQWSARVPVEAGRFLVACRY